MSDTISKEELEQLRKDADSARQKLSEEERRKVADEAASKTRAEITHEAELQKALADREKAHKELEDKLIKQQEDVKKQMEEYKKQIDDLSASQAVIKPQNPFAAVQNTEGAIDYDKLSDEQRQDMQENSARAFFGEENYEKSKRGSF